MEIAGRLGHANATVTLKHYARRVSGRDLEIAHELDQRHGALEAPTGARGGHEIRIPRPRSVLGIRVQASDLG